MTLALRGAPPQRDRTLPLVAPDRWLQTQIPKHPSLLPVWPSADTQTRPEGTEDTYGWPRSPCPKGRHLSQNITSDPVPTGSLLTLGSRVGRAGARLGQGHTQAGLVPADWRLRLHWLLALSLHNAKEVNMEHPPHARGLLGPGRLLRPVSPTGQGHLEEPEGQKGAGPARGGRAGAGTSSACSGVPAAGCRARGLTPPQPGPDFAHPAAAPDLTCSAS